MSTDTSELEFDPAYIAGVLDSIGRVRFDLRDHDDGTFTVRPELRVKPYETQLRAAVLGTFFEEQGYQAEFVDRAVGHKFFRLQRENDLRRLKEFLTGESAQLVYELTFVADVFAETFGFDLLDAFDAYRFLRTRDALRFGWRPRGPRFTEADKFAAEHELTEMDISIPQIPDVEMRADYSIPWIAGVFDGCGRYRASIAEDEEYEIGYAMYPAARLHRTGAHEAFVDTVQQFCTDHDLRYGDSSSDHELSIVFTGPASIHRVIEVLFSDMIVLAEHSEALLENILPRFRAEEEHTHRGFFELLRDFDPIAQDTGGPYRGRTYDIEYFAEQWADELDGDRVETDEVEPPQQLDDQLRETYEPLTSSSAEFEPDIRRFQSLVDRRYRDQTLVAELKQRYRDRCQVCGQRLAGADGAGYSEVHHLRPLGEPHNGSDRIENMVVLCPNHHADFDNGALHVNQDTKRITHPYDAEVDGQQLSIADDHDLAVKSLRYHNQTIYASH